MKKLDYKLMCEKIDELVETDFCFDMQLKDLPTPRVYTQREANWMARIIGNVYSVAHSVHCGACGTKYALGGKRASGATTASRRGISKPR